MVWEGRGLFGNKMLMFWFCLLQFLNFVERGAVASASVAGVEDENCVKQCSDKDSRDCRGECYTGITGDFRITNAEMGLLASLFTVGLTVASPVSAHAVRHFHPFLVIGIGQLTFTLGLLAAGFANSFGLLLGCRALLGVSEPSFIVVAPALIDAIAPPERKTLWLAIFFACISIGSAGGLGLGFIVKDMNWRWSFRIQAALNFPPALLFLFARPPNLSWDRIKGTDPQGDQNRLLDTMPPEDGEEEISNNRKKRRERVVSNLARSSIVDPRAEGQQSLWADIKALFGVGPYVCVTIGFCLVMAVSGAVLFWIPKAGQQLYDIENSDLIFGGIVVVMGLAGTLVGGGVLDRVGANFRNACLTCCVMLLVAAVCVTGSFWITPDNPNAVAFFIVMSIGYFFLTAYVAPCYSALMWSVGPELRAQAVGLATLMIHVFGDVPSPYYTGAFQDLFDDWRISFSIVSPLLVPSAFFFFLGRRLSERSQRFAELDNHESQASP